MIEYIIGFSDALPYLLFLLFSLKFRILSYLDLRL